MMEEILNEIRDFADKAHGAQTRKYTGERYIVHPVRVMEICRSYTTEITVLAAALLHDVLEDTNSSEEEILAFLNRIMAPADAAITLDLVIELTDVYEKKYYPQWNRARRKSLETARMGKISGEAQTIKYADIIDNTYEILEHDRGFGKVYLKECKNLLDHMKRGNQELRRKAAEVVTENMKKYGIK